LPALVYILVSIALALLIPWRPEPTAHYGVGAEALPCRPPVQLKRTFIGFQDVEPTLNDFEPAAARATRILSAVQQQSCALGEREDAGGGLRTALSSGSLEIARVLFTRADLSGAEIQLQAPSGADIARAEPRAPAWTLRVVCHDESTWQVVSSSRR
jgi:hypothetical protein